MHSHNMCSLLVCIHGLQFLVERGRATGQDGQFTSHGDKEKATNVLKFLNQAKTRQAFTCTGLHRDETDMEMGQLASTLMQTAQKITFACPREWLVQEEETQPSSPEFLRSCSQMIIIERRTVTPLETLTDTDNIYIYIYIYWGWSPQKSLED